MEKESRIVQDVKEVQLGRCGLPIAWDEFRGHPRWQLKRHLDGIEILQETTDDWLDAEDEWLWNSAWIIPHASLRGRNDLCYAFDDFTRYPFDAYCWRRFRKGLKLKCVVRKPLYREASSFSRGSHFEARCMGWKEHDGIFYARLALGEEGGSWHDHFIDIRHLYVWVEDGWECGICEDYIPNDDLICSPSLAGFAGSSYCRQCYPTAKGKITQHDKRARRYGRISTLTIEEWLGILHRAGGECEYCHRYVGGSHLTIEHILPLSGGGDNIQENVAAVCSECNSSKGARDIEEWQKSEEEWHLTKQLQCHFQVKKPDVIAAAIRLLAAHEGLLEEGEA